jgi:hypothetical protein
MFKIKLMLGDILLEGFYKNVIPVDGVRVRACMLWPSGRETEGRARARERERERESEREKRVMKRAGAGVGVLRVDGAEAKTGERKRERERRDLVLRATVSQGHRRREKGAEGIGVSECAYPRNTQQREGKYALGGILSRATIERIYFIVRRTKYIYNERRAH